MRNKFLLILIFISFFSCKNKNDQKLVTDLQKDSNILAGFNKGYARDSIILYVNEVCNPESKNFIPKEDRIVVFDNDGTLWVEQPVPSQLYFAINTIKQKALSGEFPWEKEFPFSAIIADDSKALSKINKAQIIELVGKAHEISNVENFDSEVQNWIKEAKHPVLNRKFTDCVYEPMLELLEYLRKNDFNIFIVSGGSVEFMRAWAPEVYSIQKPNIIGSTFKTETNQKGDSIKVAQTDKFEFNDDHEGKVISINKFIGQKPIMVVGNSDGDLEMMEYATTENKYKTFVMYLKHTDGDREFLYDDKILAGQLIKGEVEAKKRNWTIIDMKRDWNKVFKSTQ